MKYTVFYFGKIQLLKCFLLKTFMYFLSKTNLSILLNSFYKLIVPYRIHQKFDTDIWDLQLTYDYQHVQDFKNLS